MQVCFFNKKITFFFFCFALILSYRVAAQVEKFDKEKYTIYIEEKDVRIKANVLAHKTKIRAKKALTYHWYSSNKIMETQGGYDGKLLHGEYLAFYQSNNNLKEKGNFKKGLKSKQWTSWHENGKINSISHWRCGRLHGRYKTYDALGNLTGEKMYKKDKEVKFRKAFSEVVKGIFKRDKKKKAILTS